MKRSRLARRTPIRPSRKPLETRTPLKRGKPLRTRTPLRKVNPERRAAKAERKYGPGGGGGDYAVVIRALPCALCGRGRRVSLPSQEDLDKLRLSAQSECSHVIQGSEACWWHQVPSCKSCHTAGPHAVHGLGASGWGNVRGLALQLAAALAWAAVDAGVVPPDRAPDCFRSTTPAGVEQTAVQWYGSLLRLAWPTRHDTEGGGEW